MKIPYILLPLLVFFFLQSEKGMSQNSISIKKKGWTFLFNGKTTNSWKAYNSNTISKNWTNQNGVLTADGTIGDIISKNEYENFILKLQWKISDGGNSGVFFKIKEGDYDMMWRTGIEIQVVDNENNSNGKIPLRSAGSAYDLYAPLVDATKPAGKWNKLKVIVNNGTVVYWLNNHKVLKYELWTPKWYADRENSIHNKKRKPDWGEAKIGHIGLQDEGFKVWYQKIKIKKL